MHTHGPWRSIVNCADYKTRPYLIYAGSVPIATIERGAPDTEVEGNAILVELAPATLEAAGAMLAALQSSIAAVHFPQFSVAVGALGCASLQILDFAGGREAPGGQKIAEINDGYREPYDPILGGLNVLLKELKKFAVAPIRNKKMRKRPLLLVVVLTLLMTTPPDYRE